MRIDAEIRSLRAAMEPALWACGHATDCLDDEQFAGRLRGRFATLTGGEDPMGFDWSSARAPSGDYLVMLVWSEGANERHPHSTVRFSASGGTETLAFLRASLKVLRHPDYQKLLFREDPRPRS